MNTIEQIVYSTYASQIFFFVFEYGNVNWIRINSTDNERHSLTLQQKCKINEISFVFCLLSFFFSFRYVSLCAPYGILCLNELIVEYKNPPNEKCLYQNRIHTYLFIRCTSVRYVFQLFLLSSFLSYNTDITHRIQYGMWLWSAMFTVIENFWRNRRKKKSRKEHKQTPTNSIFSSRKSQLAYSLQFCVTAHRMFGVVLLFTFFYSFALCCTFCTSDVYWMNNEITTTTY